MTEIDSEHAALLKAVAANLKDLTTHKVYADFLQERGSAGWMIVANYPVESWPLWVDGQTGWWAQRRGAACKEIWRLPWLQGAVQFDKWIPQRRHLMKGLLIAYAEGRVEL